MAKHDRKGRSKFGPPFVALHWQLIDSRAWHELTTYARCAYIELARRYYGTNNGQIALSVRELAAGVPCSKRTAIRALRDLEDAGFIETVKIGRYGGQRLASEYRLTYYRCDETGELPSRRFNPKIKWVPPTGARGAPVQVHSVPHEDALGPSQGAPSAPVNHPKPNSQGAQSDPHIDIYHGGCGTRAALRAINHEQVRLLQIALGEPLFP